MKLPIVTAYLSLNEQRLLALAVSVSGLLLAGLWTAALRLFPVADPAAVLHYSIDVGIDFIGEGRQIVILPLIGTLLCGINLILGVALLRADRRASWILWSVLPVIPGVLVVAFSMLWRINAA